MNATTSLKKKRQSNKLKQAEGATKHVLKLHELAEEKLSLIQDHAELVGKELQSNDDGAKAHFSQLETMLGDLADILRDETWDEVDYLIQQK